jgi:cysteine desulfurase/selenocysteine lyase
MSVVADPTLPAPAAAPFDVERVRADFPILAREVHGKPLVYLDNAASAQKPRAVIEAISDIYRRYYANVHRGVHTLSQESTEAYERARATVARTVGASDPSEVVFVRGTTEAINLVAQSFARPRLGAGDEILVTHLEHHSNIVPWQLLAEQTGAVLQVAPIDDRGEVDLDAFAELLGPRTALVAVAHVSNALGTINPVARMAALAREAGAPVLVDGAQGVPHLPVDVQALGCDFYALSGHKAYGPSGIGALWARRELLDEMPPWQGGGEMIRSVTFEGTLYAEAPHKFEAGTPDIAGAVGLGAALDYLEGLGREAIVRHEDGVLAYATERLTALSGVRLVGTAREKAGVLSFVVDGVHPHDVGTVLDSEGVAIRTGHHCAQPVMDRYGLPATARASFGIYNTRAEADALVAAVRRVQELFA